MQFQSPGLEEPFVISLSEDLPEETGWHTTPRTLCKDLTVLDICIDI